MSEAREYKPMATHELIQALHRYENDKRHSRSVEERWLAVELKTLLDKACEVGNSRLEPESRASVNTFRAAELEREIESKRRETEALERELKKTRAA